MRHGVHGHAIPLPPSAAVAERGWVRWTLWLALAAAWLWPGLTRPTMLGGAVDWSYFTAHDISAYRSLVDHGQLPAWDPYACGGIPMIGNLQTRPIGLTALLTWLFGLWPGLRLSLLAMVVLGMEGGYRYARHRGVAGVGALLAGAAFATSGRLAQAIAEGQPGLMAFELAPWALLGLERGWRDWRAASVGGLWMALSFLEGGAVPTPLTAVLLLLVALLRTGVALWRRGHDEVAPWRPLAVLGWMATVAAGVAAFRLLPIAESLWLWPRQWQSQDVYTLGHVLNMMVIAEPPGSHTANGASYFGAPLLLMATVALLLRDKRAIWPALLFGITLDLATGTRDFLGIFPAIRDLPVLENLRHPMRFGLYSALFCATCAGVAIDALELALHHRLQRRPGDAPRLLAALLAASMAFGLALWPLSNSMIFTGKRLAGVFDRPAPLMVDQPFRQSLGNRWAADTWPALNLGTLSCFEEQPFPQAIGLRGDRAAEEFVDPPEAGTATRLAWTPQGIDVEVTLADDVTGASLVVNQNYHRAWDAGPRATFARPDGLLAVRLPPGRSLVALRFSDSAVGFGLAVSGCFLLGLPLLHHRRQRRRRDEPDGDEGEAP